MLEKLRGIRIIDNVEIDEPLTAYLAIWICKSCKGYGNIKPIAKTEQIYLFQKICPNKSSDSYNFISQ